MPDHDVVGFCPVSVIPTHDRVIPEFAQQISGTFPLAATAPSVAFGATSPASEGGCPCRTFRTQSSPAKRGRWAAKRVGGGLSTTRTTSSCCNHCRQNILVRHLRGLTYIPRHVTLSPSRMVSSAAHFPLAHYLGSGADAARADPGLLWPGCTIPLERDRQSASLSGQDRMDAGAEDRACVAEAL